MANRLICELLHKLCDIIAVRSFLFDVCRTQVLIGDYAKINVPFNFQIQHIYEHIQKMRSGWLNILGYSNDMIIHLLRMRNCFQIQWRQVFRAT